MNEVFKTVDNFPDYMVGSNGTILSLYVINSNRKKYIRKIPFILKYNCLKSGYQTVALGSQKNKKMKRLLVHRIVAQAFIHNPDNKKEVNHKNGIKTDNRVENLEWVTRSENEIHAHRNRLKDFKKDNAPNRKISTEIAIEIRKNYTGLTQKEIAKIYGVDQSLVCRVLNNKAW